MQTNIKKYQEMAAIHARQLRDPRVIGLLLFLFVLLLITWSGVKSIETNYDLQKQISKLEQQNSVEELENANLKLQNDYYNTPQYLELAARKDFGLAAKGETVLIVPRTVALAHTTDMTRPSKDQQAAKKKADQPAWQRNFQAWMDFFLHREHAD
jgi:cell division protein FtsB